MLPTSVRSNTNRECQHMSIYSRIYSNLCSKGRFLKEQHKKGSNIHRHHIIPKHSGGTDDDSNFTYLTIREHIIAHFLLWKIHKNPNDLRSMKMLGAKLTYEQRRVVGLWCKENKIGFHSDSNWASIAGKKSISSSNNPWSYWASKEGRRERASMGGKKAAEMKINVGRVWMNKNGTSKRVKEIDVDKYITNGWNIGAGYEKSEKELQGTKERAKIRAICPHCNKEGQKISMSRNHFDKCKYKRTEIGY